ncbi:histidine kinase N-terminal 7TM domain-containing protein [Halobellus ruber]|uniref:histidine kinase n=1 Tax=Halobellus ruber TaxID=2761102 RepID=A0A7J9SJ85_9EURY|nr:histidine kinase N-terminal 7TM domain-containing protein [Halobellus ruber]MBB6646086.1 GAF domain-containing protein [Halobellus ruber]
MVWQQTPYTLPLAATTAFLFGFATYLWSLDRSRWGSGTFLGGLLLFAGGSWTGLYTLRLSAATLPGKLLWIRLEFVAVLALSVIWLAYVVQYTGRTRWLTRRVFGPLAAIAAGIELLVLTDGSHHLIYREYGLTQVASFTVFDPVYGPAFAVYLGFSYTLLGASLLFLATAAVHARGVFRWQIGVLVLFSVVPGAAGILYVTDVTFVPGLNVAALSFAVSAAVVVVSFARFRWTEMTPIARDQAFEAMTEAVVVLDAKRRIIDFNAAAERVLPESGDGLMGDPVTEPLPDLAGALDGLDGADDAEAEVRTELTGSDGDDRLELDVRVSPIGVGESTGYTVLLHDITARTVAEERAEERREKIEELHRIARDLTAARTREEVFQRAVDGGEAVLGADVCRLAVVDDSHLIPAASSGEDPLDSYDPQPIDRGVAGVTFQSGAPVVVDDLAETRSATAPASGSDGGPYLADGAAAPEPTHRALLSAPVGDIGTIQALSTEPGAFTDDDREVMELLTTHIETAIQRADAEADLRTERDRLEEFASVVSHDLRNPLNVAQGRIELLKREAPAEHVEPIDRSLSRMEDIITDILTLAREGEAAGDTDTVDLELCVGDAWAIIDTGSAVIEHADELGTVEADPSRLRRLLENLFRNAIEHGSTVSEGDDGAGIGTQADPAVTVRVGRLDDREGFYVADDGPGIPAEDRGSVFEQGYTSREEGTGLGLAIVERIADAHGWTVVAAESDAGGARFEIRTNE